MPREISPNGATPAAGSADILLDNGRALSYYDIP